MSNPETLQAKTAVAAKVNEDIIALWEGEKSAPELWPMLYEDFFTDGLLTIGLNPSFSNKGWRHLEGEPDLENVLRNPSTFFKWDPNNRDKFNRDEALSAEQSARIRHPFYEAMRTLRQKTSDASHAQSWNHIDLFFVRVTDHKELRGSLFNKLSPEEIELTEFGFAQFEQFQKLLEAAKPRVVVIYNALASRIYSKHRGNCKYDPNCGCYFDKIGSRTVPVFFTGFPTFMDRFTKERLNWHVLYVLQNPQLHPKPTA